MSIRDEMVTVSLPRAALTLIEQPRAVSQRTSLAVLGLPPRDYLTLAREYRTAGGTVLAHGKLRMVEIDPLLVWMRSRRNRRAAAPVKPEHDAVAALAAELGLSEAR